MKTAENGSLDITVALTLTEGPIHINFISRDKTSFCQQLNINVRLSSSYHP